MITFPDNCEIVFFDIKQRRNRKQQVHISDCFRMASTRTIFSGGKKQQEQGKGVLN